MIDAGCNCGGTHSPMAGVQFPFTSCLPLRLSFDAVNSVIPFVKATHQNATFPQELYKEYVDKIAAKCGRMTEEEITKIMSQNARGLAGAARVKKVGI